ncbi:putative trans-sialidase, Group VI [Trypanosoma cruzi]|uniref:Trans-sialidase, putative n=2 Tax=Trypanosoma cruzi TaxID=5693 RepID=Q4DWF0_TRYCC|nr:trans-sialidase, putative [Trypanosoma cruzi]EAN96857.1 trans-sialidase, putative [Trypanosoma cruzi]PWV09600.1 putative trans-sialidase, Group VI [Trypanosoma cruzi]|eukprot:XP_818708.1 trans-sialidase [Trypanosoma cruzi strain CL Brener]
MLSRVAAVKAPRTHNRCLNTGSSGRRREGRESERQRPNMSRRVFTSAVPLLLVVMICCSTCGAAQGEEDQSSDPKFQWKSITDGVTVESFGIPGILKVGSDVFAVAEVQCKKDGNNVFTGIASELLTIKDDNKPEEALKNARVIQVLEEGASPSKRVDVSRPTAIVDGSDIYMLVGKYSRNAAAGARESAAAQSGLLLVKGTVSDEGNDSEKKNQWNVNQLPVGTLSEGEHDSWMQLIGGGGSGVKMKDGTLVFPVEGTKTTTKDGGTEEDEKTVSLLIRFSDPEIWTLSKGMSDDGCGDPSVVEWKDKLMMMTACDDGRRRVYESGDKGNTWTEALGTLSHVWGNKKRDGEGKAVGSGFTTATFGTGAEQKNVMLVTLPVYAKETQNENKKSELHLWLTDNTHIVDIGPVSREDDEDVAASALLYKSSESTTDEEKKEELIALYEKKKDEKVDVYTSSNSLWSVRLTAQLERVKEVLKTWKEADKHVSQLCPSESAVQATSPDSACKNTKITDGLVGFFSGNFSDKTWRDEYLGVNATVKKGAKEGVPAAVAEKAESSDGVTFRGAWAEWPVGSQGENQLYHFANYNFTLVATVSIGGEPKSGSVPLLGARWEGQGENKLFGLSYDSGKKRAVLCGGGQNKEHSSTWGPGKTHQVAIVLKNEKQGSAYVDGKSVCENVQCQLEGKEDKKISHFYIGGDGGNTESQEDVSVTVTNVLLYNRPLTSEEIAWLAKNTITIPKPEDPKISTTPPRSPAVSGLPVEGTVTQSNSAGQLPSEQGQPKGSNGAGAGGASTPATSTAATSSEKEPVNQLTSGTSPSGNKNVDVSSSSDADPTVVTGSGETVQGDGLPQTPEVSVGSGADGETAGGKDVQGEEEEVQPQNRDVNAAALSSSLGKLSQENNNDGGIMRGSGLLPLLLLLLGLWGFAAL